MRDPATIYAGRRVPNEGGPAEVIVCEPGATRNPPLNPRHDLRNHSPDGFQWGYAGSGPAQLSLALLCDALDDDERAQRHYQRFKFNVVALIDKDEFTMTAGKIRELVSRYDDSWR